MSKAAQDLATDPELSLIDAIYARRSVRGYLDREVPREVLDRIFEIAQQSPSNCNVQPWKVARRDRRAQGPPADQMVANTASRVPPNPDYEYRGDFVDEYRKRQVECAVALYSNMGIERGDKDGRMRAVLRNFEFFDAPYIAFIGMDQKFGTTVAIDVGMWANADVDHGGSACIAARWEPCAIILTWSGKLSGSRMAQKFCLASVLVTRTRQWQPMRPERPAIRSQPTW